MFVYPYASMYVWMYAFMSIRINVCTYVYVYVHRYACAEIYLRVLHDSLYWRYVIFYIKIIPLSKVFKSTPHVVPSGLINCALLPYVIATQFSPSLQPMPIIPRWRVP